MKHASRLFFPLFLAAALLGLLLLGARGQSVSAATQRAAYSPQATGGADDFGYVYTDSRTTPGLYHWVDIAASGTPLSFSDPDESRASLTLPQTFSFYGKSRSTLYVSTNGYANFTDSAVVTQCQPTQLQPADTLAAFCTDLNVGSRVYYSNTTAYNGHQTLIVQYERVTHTVSGLTATFQIILDFDEDAVIFQYHTVPTSTTMTTTAAINGYASNREDYLTYCRGTSGCPPQNGLAVRFSLPPRPVLGVSITPNDFFPDAGDTLTYTIVLSNTGDAAASGAVLTNSLPTGLDYLSGTLQASAGTAVYQSADRLIRWDGDLAVQTPVTLTYAARLNALDYPYNTVHLSHPRATDEARASSVPLETWHDPSEPLDAPHKFDKRMGSWRYLAIDSSGVPHIATAGAGLYYTTLSGTTWLSETVPGTPSNLKRAALTLDDQDRALIAFYGDNRIRLARQTSSGQPPFSWTVEDIYEIGWTDYRRFALDLRRGSDGRLHLVYDEQGYSDSNLYYTVYDGSRWMTPTLVITAGECDLEDYGFSLALDISDTLHLACVHHSPSPQEVRVYTATTTAPWTNYSVVISGSENINYPSLRYDGQQPHVSYFMGDHLYHATYSGGAWQNTMVDTASGSVAYRGPNTSLDIRGGKIGIAYAFDVQGSSVNTSTVRLAMRPLTGTLWTTETVETLNPNYWSRPFPVLALTPQGGARMAYYHDPLEALRYAAEDSLLRPAAAALSLPDRSRDVGVAAVAVAQNTDVHVIQASKGLRYYVNPAGTTTWTQTIAIPDVAAQWVDLALDDSGNPHAVYADNNAPVYYANNLGGSWTAYPADQPGNAESHPAVSAEVSGTAHIVYMAEQGSDLAVRHGFFNGTSLVTETLAVVGPETWDHEQKPQVVVQGGKTYVMYADCNAYQASGNYPIELMLATWDGSAWNTQSLYRYTGQCNTWSLDYQLKGDADGQLGAVVDISSTSVRPEHLVVTLWLKDAGTLMMVEQNSGPSPFPKRSAPPAPPDSAAPQTPQAPNYTTSQCPVYFLATGGWLGIYSENAALQELGYTKEGAAVEPVEIASNRTDDSKLMDSDRGGDYEVEIEKDEGKNKVSIPHTERPAASPVLTLSGGKGAQSTCAGAAAGTDITIFDGTISVDDVDDWNIYSIQFQTSSSGYEAGDIDNVKFYVNGALKATKPYADNAAMSFNIGQVLGASGSMSLRLDYEVSAALSCEHNVEDLSVSTKAAWVSAEPLQHQDYSRQPASTFSGGPLTLACVRNTNTDTWFDNIQAGINDSGTQDGHTLELCPGAYNEQVTVNKSLVIRAQGDADNTQVSGGSSGAVFEVSDTGSGTSLQGLGITGGAYGVFISSGVSGVTIGGENAGEGNKIHGNTVGVAIADGSTDNRILGNRIYDSGQIAIDLNDDGLTRNDLDDNDEGANHLQNFPIIGGVDGTLITGTLNSEANKTYRIELYEDSQCDPEHAVSSSDAETFIGSLNVTTDNNGTASFSYHAANPVNGYVLATATDPDGNTSELSPCDNNLVFVVENDGDVYADGAYQTPAADIAELWPVSALSTVALKPGDVLALGPDGGVMLAGLPEAGAVIGIYATRPGMLGGGPAQAGPEAPRVPVAMVGVVPLRVSAANGAIRPGDLLTVGGQPGTAVRARPVVLGGEVFYPSGTFFAKALEGYSGESAGYIRVLLPGR